MITKKQHRVGLSGYIQYVFHLKDIKASLFTKRLGRVSYTRFSPLKLNRTCSNRDILKKYMTSQNPNDVKLAKMFQVSLIFPLCIYTLKYIPFLQK